MSYIVHHPGTQPRVAPTIDCDGQLITRVVPPGGRLNPQADGTAPNPVGPTCDCGDCQQLFDSVAVAA